MDASFGCSRCTAVPSDLSCRGLESVVMEYDT